MMLRTVQTVVFMVELETNLDCQTFFNNSSEETSRYGFCMKKTKVLNIRGSIFTVLP